MSAEQGFTEAQYRLGLMYLNGIGVKQSNTEALLWFKQATDKKDGAKSFAQEIEQKMNSKSKDSGNESAGGCSDTFGKK